MNNPVDLQLATPADAALISEMAERIWNVHYVPMIGQQQVDYMLGKMYSKESLSEQMNAGQQFFIARVNGKPVGYIAVSKKTDSDFFMHKFYMEIEEQGKGWGRKIFAEMLSRFPELKTIRLQVNRMNYKTINFYFRIGFVIEEAKDFDIGDGYFMNDYVMIFSRE